MHSFLKPDLLHGGIVMNAPVRLDARIIGDVCEPVSWWTEYHFQKNCFWIARVALLIACTILWTASTYAFGATPQTIAILTVVTIFCVLPELLLTVATEREVLRRPNLMNPYKSHWQRRIGTALMTAALVLINVTHGGAPFSLVATFVLIADYFLACNPMPPGWSPPRRVVALQGA